MVAKVMEAVGPRRCWLAVGAVVVVAALAGGCGGKKRGRGAVAAAPRVALGATEDGIASWYGHPYHGRRTTSGEVYDMEQMTAAHRTLPFGTRVQVERLDNGRETEVRITDRGPFVEGRIIDLSRAAARRIEMIGPGTARVRVRVVGLPQGPSRDGVYAVQVGAFAEKANAQRLRESLARDYGGAALQEYDSPKGLLYRVLVGREGDLAGAEALERKLRGKGHRGFVVRVDNPL